MSSALNQNCTIEELKNALELSMYGFEESNPCNNILRTIQQQSYIQAVVPAAVELFLYGIYVVLFGLCIYIFRRRYMPGKVYVIATITFFLLATATIVVDFAGTKFFVYSTENPEDYRYLYLYLVAGVLADALLIYRCYIIWGSSVRIIILPILGLLFNLAVGIALPWLEFFSAAFIIDTLCQNVLLTGLIAGRIVWLDRQTRHYLHSESRTKSRRLLTIVLESGLVYPIFIAFWLIEHLALVDEEGTYLFIDDGIISVRALTQVLGIVSTMIIIRLGLDGDSNSTFNVSRYESVTMSRV